MRGQWQARWHYDYGPEKIAFSALVESADGKVSRKLPLLATPPQDRYLRGVLGKLAWTSPTRLALQSKDGAVQGSAEVTDG